MEQYCKAKGTEFLVLYYFNNLWLKNAKKQQCLRYKYCTDVIEIVKYIDMKTRYIYIIKVIYIPC